MPKNSDLLDLPQCNRCNKYFKLNIMLKKHRTNCNELSTKDGNWCPICNKSIVNQILGKRALATHIICHPEVEQLIMKEKTCIQNNSAKCGQDCKKWQEFLFKGSKSSVYHKYVDCKSSQTNLEEIISKVLTKGDNEKSIQLYKTTELNKNNASIHTIPEKSNIKRIRIRKRQSTEIFYDKENSKTSKIESNCPAPQQDSMKKAVKEKIKGEETQQNNEEPSNNSYDTTSVTYSSLKCTKCLRCFTTKDELKSSTKHLCTLLAKDGKSLQTPLLECSKPSSIQTLLQRCIICHGENKPIFSSDTDLMAHFILAHKFKFFMKEFKRYGITNYPTHCPFCIKNLSFNKTILNDLEEALLHIGIKHEKLFQALKHDPKFNFKFILKRMFKDKYKKYYGKGENTKKTISPLNAINSTQTSTPNPHHPTKSEDPTSPKKTTESIYPLLATQTSTIKPNHPIKSNIKSGDIISSEDAKEAIHSLPSIQADTLQYYHPTKSESHLLASIVPTHVQLPAIQSHIPISLYSLEKILLKEGGTHLKKNYNK